MAEYRGKTVTLNKPRRISKGSPGFGKKTREVFVRVPASGKIKRVTFGDPKLGAHPGNSKKRTVKLSSSEIAISRKLGITPEQYAKQVLKMQAERNVNPNS